MCSSLIIYSLVSSSDIRDRRDEYIDIHLLVVLLPERLDSGEVRPNEGI